MKVSIIGPVYPYRGGIAQYNALLALSLDAHQHPTQVISFRRQYPAWLYPGTSDKDPSQQIIQIQAEFLLDPILPWTWRQAVARIAQFHPDLVIIHWWTTFWAVSFAFINSLLNRKGFRVVYLIHNVMPHEQKPWDAWLARLALGKGHAFITQTEAEQKRLQSLLPGAVIRLCYHPVYHFSFAPLPSQVEARERLGLDPEGTILLFFGIVRPYKGLHVLLDALARLRQSGHTAQLVIAGEFWEDKAAYLTKIKDLNLSDQVKIEDRYIPNEQLGGFFSAANALVAPYTTGTQSGVANLALGYGLHQIVTQVVADGIPPAYQADIQVVPPENPEALAEAIRFFIQHPDRFKQQEIPTDESWTQLVSIIQTLAPDRPPEKR
jgi:glycosyltransferase involved in cell wall biosynthesis